VGAPWSAWEPANLRFCEALVDGWVREPANTWSNVGFFVAAGYVAVLARRDRRPAAGWLWVLALATGLGSTAFHATATLAGQLVDQSVMLLESSYFVARNLGRRLELDASASVRLERGTFGVVSLGSIMLLLARPTWGVALFTLHAVVFVGLELSLFFWPSSRGRIPRVWPLALVGLTFAASLGAWWLDRSALVCEPDNHVFGGHALWHLLGALSFVLWYRHYEALEPGVVGARAAS
jgi:hypothetical protein